MLVEDLLAGNAEAITRKLIDQAQAGNPEAIAMLARSLLPQRRGTPIRIDLPELEEATDAATAIAAIYGSVCAGELTPADGNALIRMVEAFLRAKQKTGNAERRPEQEKAAHIAAAKPAAPLQPHVSFAREVHWEPVIPGRGESGEPGTYNPMPVGMDSGSRPYCASGEMTPLARENLERSLPRLRQEALSSTSSLAQSVRRPPAIVSHCIPTHGSPAAANGSRVAA
jgi:hypothetical protein